MAGTFEIREYTEAGRSPFAEWFNDLDSVTAARAGSAAGAGSILGMTLEAIMARVCRAWLRAQ